ncbi:ABC transporter ATP-binding protein [Desulfovibrio sulfodismutans]|uniref:ABC transporter ATP-binding protein n=1 Tax=Desulfolutivibrio sulfodismutans TaxID=63561 RepID=A0A7K3NMY3_9BACT|nr:ABC transporter ATP-binding protein [Desulfolutivibrio sulfodismutans]NDY57183.1 ABC transporter ATP-binding protein [Desulfolutivibrio sulfodismutans]QLA11825.1 ATP-binding cassette domain-containing protein [Desulfolutivibrio sulfodismutans DSM 3696]
MIALVDVRLTLPSQAGPVNILRGITFTAAAGETVAIMGPSGAGKTTLLMLMAGLEKPSSGRVVVAGRDLTDMDEDALARFRRENAGIVFQAFHLVPTMTALENVALPLELARADDAGPRAMAALEAVGLSGRASHYPSQLSGGEQQRVALARAFAPRPKILLADEPTGNLDEETGAMVMDLLFSLGRDHGVTLVLITHDAALAARCGRVAHVRDGRLIPDGASEPPAGRVLQ